MQVAIFQPLNPCMMKPHSPARLVGLLLLVSTMSACSEPPSEKISNPDAQSPRASAQNQKSAAKEWEATVLNLIGDRFESEAPLLEPVKQAFSFCQFGSNGSALDAKCEPSVSNAGSDLSELMVKLLPEGDRVKAIRLTACCSPAPREPFASQSVIRSEKFCPDVTFVASQSTRLHRVSAAGKQDFVAATVSNPSSSKQTVSYTILLPPLRDGFECEDFAAVERALSGT